MNTRLLAFPAVLLILVSQVYAESYGEPLSYWIEANGSPTRVWVKVPYIPPKGEVVLYAVKTAGYSPNPQNVFDYWTEFTGTTLPTGWTCLAGTCTMTGGYVDVTGTDSETAYLVNDTAITGPATIEANVYVYGANAGTGGYGADFRLQANNTTAYPTDLVIPLGWYSLGGQYYWQTEVNLNWSPKMYINYSPSWTVLTVKWVPSEEVNIYLNYTLEGMETSVVPDDPLYYVIFSKPVSFVRVAWVRVRRYAPEEPSIEVINEESGRYKIVVHNPNNISLTDYQIAIPASDLNVSNTAESILITPLVLSMQYSPTELNELALDPENGINEVNVTYTVNIDSNIEITEVNIDGNTYGANAPLRGIPSGAVGLTANGLACHGYQDYLYGIYTYPADEVVSVYVDFIIDDNMGVTDAHVATVFGDNSIEFGIRINQGNVEVVGFGSGTYQEPAVAGQRYRFLFQNSPDGFKVWKVTDGGATLVLDGPTPATGFGGEGTILCAYSTSATDQRMFFQGVVHQLTIWERELTSDEIQALANGEVPTGPVVHTHFRGGYLADPYLYVYQAAVFPTEFNKDYTEVGDYNTCISVAGYDGGGTEYNAQACAMVHIDMYPQVSIIPSIYIPFQKETVVFDGNVIDNGTVKYFWDSNWDVVTWQGPFNANYIDEVNVTADYYRDYYTYLWIVPKHAPVYISGIEVCVYAYGSCSSSTTFTLINYETGEVYDTITKTFAKGLHCLTFNINTVVYEPIHLKLSRNGCYYPSMYQIHTTYYETNNFYFTGNPNLSTSAWVLVINKIYYGYPESNSIVLNFPEVGSFPVTLTVTDNVGLTKEVTENIAVYSTPDLNAPTSEYVDKDVTATINHDSRLSIAGVDWNTTDTNAYITEYIGSAIIRFLTLGEHNIYAHVTFKDSQNHTRDVNLVTSITIIPIHLSIVIKDESNLEDWNTEKVDLTRIEVWDDQTGEFKGSVDNNNKYEINLTRYHLYRVTLTIQGGGVTYARTYYVKGYDMQLTTYALNPIKGLFYTFFVTDFQNNPLEGYIVTVMKYLDNAWATITERKSNPDGSVSAFITPSAYYQVRVSKDDRTIKEFTMLADPNLRNIYIRINPDLNSFGEVNIHTLWDTVTYSITPAFESNDLNVPIRFYVDDPEHRINCIYMKVIRRVFNRDTNVAELNMCGSPAGGELVFTPESYGTYIVTAGVIRDRETYELPPYTIIYHSTAYFSGPLGISDFAYILVATISTFAVVGFTAQFSPGASGILGLVVLGAFTLLNPTATVAGISLWQIFLFTTLIVLGISFVRTYL